MEQSIWKSLDALHFIGTGTSHFQSEPICQIAPPAIDWEDELRQNLRGQKSCIKFPQKMEELPRLLKRTEAYVDRSAELGMNMYRFSIDLGRLNPRPGEFNSNLMAAYVRFMAHLKQSRQEPMVTLHHFTMPFWLSREKDLPQSAWQHPAVLNHFSFTMGKVVEFLSNPDSLRQALTGSFKDSVIDSFIAHGLVRYFIPINEPLSVLGHSYIQGDWPPYKRGRFDLAWRTLRTMREAYSIMEQELRELGKLYPHFVPRIGNGYNWQFFDGIGSGVVHSAMNELLTRYLEKTVPTSDWMGLHYYCASGRWWNAPDRNDKEQSDHPMFKDIYPPGILPLLEKMHAAYPEKEIIVSEIGFSDANDERRPDWIFETMRYILEARARGVPVSGVLYWSLADMFEWDLGMSQKFGLFSEAELYQPLAALEHGVRSWQVWQTIGEYVQHPSMEVFERLLRLEHRADRQHLAARVPA